MAVHQDCAVGIMSCLKSLWEQQDFLDYEVKVEDDTFKCHRLILATCSPFFNALFRSNWKETTDEVTTLNDMSSATFKLILTAIYTGSDVLTGENVIDVWKATHLLQIDFMIKHCEKRVVQGLTVNNFEEMYAVAKLLESHTVVNCIIKFIIRNFDRVRYSKTFRQLPPEEMLTVVKSNEIVVHSEDNVLDAILKWVDDYKDVDVWSTDNDGAKPQNHVPGKHVSNEGMEEDIGTESEYSKSSVSGGDEKCVTFRESPAMQPVEAKVALPVLKRKLPNEQRGSGLRMLAPLLKAARTRRATPASLEKLFKNVLVQADKKAKNIIFDAVMYQLSTRKDTQSLQSSPFGGFSISAKNYGLLK